MTEAKIVYLPHCSKCGVLLRGKVSVELERDYIVERFDNSTIFNMPHYVFEPYECPNCGASFDRVIYPTSKDDRKEPFTANTESHMECKIQ